MDKQIKNYGFIDEKVRDEDYKFGAESPLGSHPVLLESTDWTDYLPTDELQKDENGGEDSMACTNFSFQNDVESIFELYIKNGMLHIEDYKWLKEKGYFDENGKIKFNNRFNAKMSGTTRRGNSMRNPVDSARKDGLIPWSVWKYEPFYNNQPFVWEDYYQKPPQEAIDLGKEFLKRFKINYETVWTNTKDLKEARKYSPVHTAVHAWPYPVNDVYPRTAGSFNHAIINHANEWDILDHYKINGTFIKKLAPDFIFLSYGFVYFVTTLINPLTFTKIMKLKNNHLYQEVEQSGSFGVAVDDKLIVGDTASILATFIMRNNGDINGKCVAVKKEDWDSVNHYNPGLELQKEE